MEVQVMGKGPEAAVVGDKELRLLQIKAQVEILEWSLTLRHNFSRVDGAIPTRRQMPQQIKTAVEMKVYELKQEANSIGLELVREGRNNAGSRS